MPFASIAARVFARRAAYSSAVKRGSGFGTGFLGVGALARAFCSMRVKLIEMWARRMWPIASQSPISAAASTSTISWRKARNSAARPRSGIIFSTTRATWM